MAINFIPDNETSDGDTSSPSKIHFIPDDGTAQSNDNNSGFLNDILKIGGTAGRAIGYGLADTVNAPLQLGDLINRGAAKLIGANPNKIPQPIYADAQSLPMPGVSSQDEQTLDPIARGLTTAAETAPIAAAGMDIARVGLPFGKTLLKKLQDVSFVKNLTGKNIEEATQQFESGAKNTLTDLFGESKISPADELAQNTHESLEQMYGTPDYKNMIGKENQILSQDVFNAHKKNYEEGSARFENTLSNTNPVVSQEDSFIKPRESAQLDKLMQMDPLLADKIITANKTPNLRNLHEIQSQMGAMIADKKSVPYSQRDNESINLLSNFRDKIINNISNYAPQYKDDQAFWKNNVIPYYQNSAINKLVRTGVTPSNISNILSKPELADQANKVPGTVNTILRHLTPQQKQYIPLAKLSGSQSNPLLDMNGNINAENFAKNTQGLTTKNLQQFITPPMRQKLMSLGQDLKNAKLHAAITNNVQDVGGNVNPDQLVKNIASVDPKLIDPRQQMTLQQSLSKLTDLSKNISTQKENFQNAVRKLNKLKKPARALTWGALAGSGLYGAKKVFEGGEL